MLLSLPVRTERSQAMSEQEPYRFWWGEISDASAVALPSMPLMEILAGWVPSSMPQPWSWDDEERAIFERVCLCCGEVGHHQRGLEAFLAEYGLSEGVCLGECGRVFDGHHRIIAARRLGIEVIPLESRDDSGARWLRDFGPVAWGDRTTGDIAPNLYRPLVGGRLGHEGATDE